MKKGKHTKMQMRRISMAEKIHLNRGPVTKPSISLSPFEYTFVFFFLAVLFQYNLMVPLVLTI